MANDELLQGKYVVGKSSVVGDSRRKWEDRVYTGEIKREHDDSLIVGIVADGIATADMGSRGAQLAVDTVVAELSKSKGNDIPDLIERAMQAANRVVYSENQKNEKEGWTTLVIAIIHGNRCFIGNVGDSRAYWAQEDGTFLPLTKDHTFYNIYGGDPNAENAVAVVNTIGVKSETQVDPGFYLKPEMTKEQAHRIGYAGLPLKSGEAIVLCSDGLIKTDKDKNRYAKDEEIVNALQTEYETDKAAIKMVGVAEGRRPTDNVSAVTIQYLSGDLIKKRRSHSAQAARMRFLRRVALITASIVTIPVILVLAFFAFQPPTTITNTTVVIITLTPAPTLPPTATIVPGKARVEDIYGTGGEVQERGENSELVLLQPNQLLDSGGTISASSDGVKIVVREQGNTAGVMYWFGGSIGKVNFDPNHMIPVLENGALYVQPGKSKAEVKFTKWPDITASVEGSRMIVELTENEIWVFCFEGTCRLDYGNEGFKIPVNSKQSYNAVTGAKGPLELMPYDEGLYWNVKCNSCMDGFIPTPTPIPTKAIIQPVSPTKEKPGDPPSQGTPRP